MLNRRLALLLAVALLAAALTGCSEPPDGPGTSSDFIPTPSPTYKPDEDALKEAQQYLHSQRMSKQGLFDQLVYDGFSPEAAKQAVETCGADWQAQANKAAEEYQKLFEMTRGELKAQLESDGWTPDEAARAAQSIQ